MRCAGRAALCAACLLAVPGPAAAQDLSPFLQVSPSVLVYLGHDGERTNAGIIRTPLGYVLVDAGETPADGERIRQALLPSRLDVRYLILTEPHPDRHLGAFLFSPPAVLIAHGATRAALAGRLAARAPEGTEGLRGYRVVLPDLTFTDAMTLFLGGVEVRMLHLPDARTQGDAAVWLPQERVLFGGGAVRFEQHLDLAGGSSAGALRALDRLAALGPTVVVPGRGRVGGPEDLGVLRRYVLDLRAEVRRLRAAGHDLQGTLRQARLPGYDGWAGREGLPRTLGRIYRELGAP